MQKKEKSTNKPQTAVEIKDCTPNYPSAADQQCLRLSEMLFKQRLRAERAEASILALFTLLTAINGKETTNEQRRK